MMHRGFGGDHTIKDQLVYTIPFIALAIIAAGVIWRRADKKFDEESRRR
jgi:hypothetical protein